MNRPRGSRPALLLSLAAVATALVAVAAPATAATSKPLLKAMDGAGVYGRYSSNTLPTSSSFFPIGVWEEQYVNAPRLQTHGWNMIVNPVGTRTALPANFYTVGALEDEADMWAGPGSATWTGNYPGQGAICSPSTASCGFSVMAAHQRGVPAGAMRYTNYGKGVAFWDSDAAAAQFVNAYQDTTSVDLYWGTDGDLCQRYQGGVILGTGADVPAARCHQPSNYGATVDRVRELVEPLGSKPVWNYVELGTPGANSTAMPVNEIKPAVWSSLIHGARGIVYFNHSFGGSCQSQHVIDDCGPAVAAVVNPLDAQITSLARQLNAPKVRGVVKTGQIDQATKWDGQNFYVFTGSTTTGSAATTGSVKLACIGNATATVLGENRTVPVVKGKLSDTWADQNAVHLYKITGGSHCGLT